MRVVFINWGILGGIMTEVAISFARLVSLILTVDKTAEANIDSIAHKMGITASTLRSRIRHDDQRTKFTIDELKSLIQATEDLRLVDFFLEETSFIVSRRISQSGNGKVEDIKTATRDGADDAMIETADVLETVLHALKDGNLGHREKAKIISEIEGAERSLASLKAVLEA